MTDHRTTPEPQQAYVVGIDLGGTKIRGGISTTEGSILADHTLPTNGGTIVGQIAKLVQQLAADASVDADQIIATGIGGAGVPDKTGKGYGKAPNLSGVEAASFADELARELTHRVVLENDANVAALGELHYGVGLAHQDFVVISVGTGIGMGIVSQRRLLRGAHGAAGEIGFLPLGSDPLDTANWRRGPLEEVVAGDAITRRYLNSTNSEKTITSPEVFARAAQGDLAAEASLDEHAKWIATAIVAVAAVLDPEVFVLAGGIGTHADLLPRITNWLERLGAPHLDVRISELGDRAPVVGAVRLALETTQPAMEGHTR